MSKKSVLYLVILLVALVIGGGLFVMKMISNIDESISELSKEFEQLDSTVSQNPDLSNLPKAINQDAVELDNQSNLLVEKIEQTKEFLVKGYEDGNEEFIYDTTASIRILALKKSIIDYQEFITEHFKDQHIGFEQYLFVGDHTMGGKSIPWEEYYFHHAPLGAVMTILTKYQSEVRTIESQILDKLMIDMDKSILDSDTLS